MAKVNIGGYLVIKRLMRPSGVVELEIVGQAGFGVSACSVRFQENIFIFHAPP